MLECQRIAQFFSSRISLNSLRGNKTSIEALGDTAIIKAIESRTGLERLHPMKSLCKLQNS